MATQRPMGKGVQLRAYAGIDPATGRKHYLYDQVPAGIGKRELDRRARALDAAAHELLESRRARRRDPAIPRRPARPRAAQSRTVADAVEAWWKHHGSKLAGAPKTRPLIDGIILPELGYLKIALVAGSPPDDPADRDDDLVYLSERWEEIRLTGRRNGDEPLKPSVIHKLHGIVGAALRRAGHPVLEPGLPSMGEAAETTPLPEEMAAFLPYLAATGRTTKPYTVTRRVRDSTDVARYEVPARPLEPSAMDLMTEAFALLVGSGPRPVEAAALTRAQVDLDTGSCSFDGHGVVLVHDDDSREQWVVAGGTTAKRRRRVITLDPRALAALRRWLSFQDAASLAMGERLTGRALVFSLDPGGAAPVSPKVFSKAFARAVDRARAGGATLPDGFCLYSCRHYGITSLLRAGRPVAAVARRFGTSARMIHARYEHAIPEDDGRLADTLADAWGPTSGDAEVIGIRS